jgi:senataxin
MLLFPSPQGGCPVKILTVQYRMHPDIRTFPSRFFYQDRLEDAPEILARPPVPFAAAGSLLQPYMVFDVSRGRERYAPRMKSPENEAEADMALALYQQLQLVMEKKALEASKAGQPPPAALKVRQRWRQ